MLSQLFLLLLPLMCSSSVALFRRRICVCVCVRNAICCNKTSKKKTFRHKTFNIMKLLRHLRTWAPDHTTFLESQPTALWIAANMDVIWCIGLPVDGAERVKMWCWVCHQVWCSRPRLTQPKCSTNFSIHSPSFVRWWRFCGECGGACKVGLR